MAIEAGFEKILLTGHIGKLIKVAGGIMNTHSREADCRMEILAALALKRKVRPDILESVLECTNTEEALGILQKTGKLPVIMQDMLERILFYLNRRIQNNIKKKDTSHVTLAVFVYSNEYGELAKSKLADEYIDILKR